MQNIIQLSNSVEYCFHFNLISVQNYKTYIVSLLQQRLDVRVLRFLQPFSYSYALSVLQQEHLVLYIFLTRYQWTLWPDHFVFQLKKRQTLSVCENIALTTVLLKVILSLM